jgi:pyrroline-5-carboxylate reductase
MGADCARFPPTAGDGAARAVGVGRAHAMLARMARIAIVGGGSIGEALLSGLLRAGRQVKDLVVAEKSPERAKYLSNTYSVLVTTVTDAVDTATYVVVAVKPADVGAVVAEIAEAVVKAESDTAEQVFVSVVAGVTTEFYENKLPAGSPVIRVMPNAPVVVGGGVSALARGRFATADHLKEVSAIFDAVGGVLTVPESQLDAVTAVSGSGPAYFFLMVEALVDAGVAAGLTRSVSTDLVVQTMAGSAAMLLERLDEAQPAGDAAMGTAMDTTAAQLRATVTSPGGTTAAGLRELERGGLRAAVAAAVEAAKRRSEQLGITSE